MDIFQEIYVGNKIILLALLLMIINNKSDLNIYKLPSDKKSLTTIH